MKMFILYQKHVHLSKLLLLFALVFFEYNTLVRLYPCVLKMFIYFEFLSAAVCYKFQRQCLTTDLWLFCWFGLRIYHGST